MTTPDDPADVVDLEPGEEPARSVASPDRGLADLSTYDAARPAAGEVLRLVLGDPLVDLLPPRRTATRSGPRARRGSRRAAPATTASRSPCPSAARARCRATVSRWSRPVCATSTTSASGAASSAASSPPGRGASTWVIRSARRAIRSSPSLRSRSMPRRRRSGVKLPPSGKITNASFSSRSRARSAIWASKSWPRAGAGGDEARRDAVHHHVDRPGPRRACP